MLLNVFFTTIPTKETLIVKLHFKHANPTGLQLDGVGVDFVSPPSQQNISPATHGKYPQQPTTLTKIYKKEVYYRLGIWHIDLTHKTNTR